MEPNQLDLEVPHIDGWTPRTVIEHTALVLRFGCLALAAPPDELPAKSNVETRPEGAAILDWFADAVDEATKALDAADLNAMCPTWTGPQPASWYLRRLTHELSVHRWDAQAAIGEPDPIDPNLAVDGIDELLEIYMPRRMDFGALAGAGETVHLHATDHESGEWLLTFEQDGIKWDHSHTKADVAARGPASDLLLLLWGRKLPTDVETFGNVELLSRWASASSF